MNSFYVEDSEWWLEPPDGDGGGNAEGRTSLIWKEWLGIKKPNYHHYITSMICCFYWNASVTATPRPYTRNDREVAHALPSF